jgi:hypothetical protein
MTTKRSVRKRRTARASTRKHRNKRVTPRRKLSRSRHLPKRSFQKVTVRPEKVPKEGREGAFSIGFSAKQLEFREMLLQPGVKTYADAAARLGITENAGKQRMSRSNAQVARARMVIREDEAWKRKRREAKKGNPQPPREVEVSP